VGAFNPFQMADIHVGTAPALEERSCVQILPTDCAVTRAVRRRAMTEKDVKLDSMSIALAMRKSTLVNCLLGCRPVGELFNPFN
jgi:hypothetical protein